MLNRVSSAAVLVLAMAACGSSTTASTTASQTPTPSPTASPTPSGPTGPPAAHGAVVGDAGLTGALTFTSIECSAPGLAGSSIVTFANPPNKNISIRMVVASGNIQLRVDSGSGSTYRERDFMGTGVTAFDAANGATIDAHLTETTAAGSATSGIGALTSISGSIDCMHQQPGSATMTFSAGGAGVVSGGLTSVRVICLNQATGDVVQIFGIGQTDTTPESVGLFVFPNGFNMFLTPTTGTGRYYAGQPGGVETLTGTSTHVDAVGLLKLATGTSTATVHVTGDATCGSSTTP
jgi:hypothetical protein